MLLLIEMQSISRFSLYVTFHKNILLIPPKTDAQIEQLIDTQSPLTYKLSPNNLLHSPISIFKCAIKPL